MRGFVREDGRVVGVSTAEGEVRADRVVLAAGAWSGELLGLLGMSLPVEPVKGQMILFKCAADFLPAMVLAKGRYAIPRRDGHILVGSTLEHAGFDKTPTTDALESLKASAFELLPQLADAELVGHWAGLRPGSPEGIPFIGPVPGADGLWLNCGHYRNGLVLAPASCRLLADLMLGRAPIIDPAPYAPAGCLG
ncbi:Glycine oxidase [compost metagenome]